MTKNRNERRHDQCPARRWTSPKLTRLQAGRAELSSGPNADLSDFS
jgi:hypothetical protein